MGIDRKEINDRYYKSSRRKVAQIDIQTGDVLNVFESLHDAANFIGIKRITGISNAINRGTNRAYGFQWETIE